MNNVRRFIFPFNLSDIHFNISIQYTNQVYKLSSFEICHQKLHRFLISLLIRATCLSRRTVHRLAMRLALWLNISLRVMACVISILGALAYCTLLEMLEVFSLRLLGK
jgi:hypothetical protein